MQSIRLESDKGTEIMVGANGNGRVWVTVQNVRASIVTELNQAQADLLSRALRQACSAVAVMKETT
jgi:exosome complex RNA-binding protein Rrp4